MKRRHLGFLAILAAASLALWTPPAAAQASDYSYARVVRLSLVDGDVQVFRPDQSQWEQAMVNLPLQEGFSIATGQGRAEIEFESGATARLAENSVLQFTQLALSDGGRLTQLTLTQGTASFYANLTSQDSFVVLTPTVQVSIPGKASFRVDASDAGSNVSVMKGEVSVDSQAGTNRVTKGHTLAFNPSDPDNVEIRRNSDADEWDSWVADREEVIHTGNTATLRYVNSPYTYGLSDLSNYGGWYNYGGYGRCWRPNGVGFGWSPFWNGNWAFYSGLGWTWLSVEPWGWVPYHFGSWVFSPAYGWLWVPGFFQQWQPARVAWVRVGTQTAWVPVHPHDQIGQTPANLQQGAMTTPNGFIGANPNAKTGFIGAEGHKRILVGADEHIRLLKESEVGPPAGQSAVAGGAPATPPPPGIVYDSKGHTWVNNPARPGNPAGKVGDARRDGDGVRPAKQGSSGSTPPTKVGDAPRGAGDTRPVRPGYSGSIPPKPPAPPPAPPQAQPQRPVSPPPPAPKADRPQPQTQSAPHPAQQWQSAPRAFSPAPAPRSESRAAPSAHTHWR